MRCAHVGPLLAERARRAGVVYTLASGDQPGAIFETAEWARTLEFENVCAGRGTVLFADDHHATPEKYIDTARNRMNPKMYPSSGTAPSPSSSTLTNVASIALGAWVSNG
jgi:predicted homoserine dehydrogenase-like protein